MSSPFPFCIGYVFNYVCHCGSLLWRWCDRFCLTFSIFLSIARWHVSSFFTNACVQDHVWHPYVSVGKTRCLKTFLVRLTRVIGRCLSRNISNNNNNDDNNNHIQRRYLRYFTISSQRLELSPTCTLKWPRRNRVQITCNTSSAYHV